MNRKRASSSLREGAVDLRKKQRIEDEPGFLLIYCSPLCLKHLAGLKVALSVWRHHSIRFSKNYGRGFLKYNTRTPHGSIVYVPAYVNNKDYSYDATPVLNKPIKDSIEELSLPKPIKKLVEDYGKFIQREMRYWAYCHNLWIKLEAVDFNTDIVWKYDGFVDLLATARKMLESTRFSLEERFCLMSMYCMEDEIRSISQRLTEDGYGFVQNISTDCYLAYYWKFYLYNSLHKLNWTGYTSLNQRMLFYGARNNIESLAYFFNRLNKDEVVPVSICLILYRAFEFKYKAYLLSRLNRTHHHQVLLKCAETVIIDLSRYSAYSNYLSNVWINYKKYISNDQFVKIIYSIFQNGDIDETNVDHTETLLCDIWHTATDEMKNDSIWSNISKVKMFLVNCFRLMAERWTFFKTMFNDASDATKNVIVNDSQFSSFCVSSIETGQWYLCDSFIKICFSFASNERIMEFKNTLMTTHKTTMTRYCRELIKQNLTKELQELLVLYLPDTDSVMAYKKDLLVSKAQLKMFGTSELLADRVDELVKTLDYVCSSPESAANYRKELATQTRILKKMCQYLNEGKFGKMKALFDRLLVRNEDFELVKAKLWTHYKNIFKSGKCKQLRNVEWDEFLSWRSNSDKDEFKKSLPVDDIFMKMLKQTGFDRRFKKDLNVEFNFEELDYFLGWYFDNKDQISRYKIDKISLNGELAAILKNSPESDSLKMIVEWFFDNDQRRIEEFKRTDSLDVSVLNVQSKVLF